MKGLASENISYESRSGCIFCIHSAAVGFESARTVGTEIVLTLMEDSRTTNRWFVVVVMGRKAGHLALGIGKSAGATLTLIAEEFESPARLHTVVDTLAGAIIKRLSYGRHDGVAVIAEGVVLGTRFLATPEAPIHENFKQAIVKSDGHDTVATEIPDIAAGHVWPGALARTQRNAFIARWAGQEWALRQNRAEAAKAVAEQLRAFAEVARGYLPPSS